MQFHTIPDNGVILTNFFPAAVVQSLIIWWKNKDLRMMVN